MGHDQPNHEINENDLDDANSGLLRELQLLHSEIGGRLAEGALRGSQLKETNSEVIDLWRRVREDYESCQAGAITNDELTRRYTTAKEILENIQERVG